MIIGRLITRNSSAIWDRGASGVTIALGAQDAQIEIDFDRLAPRPDCRTARLATAGSTVRRRSNRLPRVDRRRSLAPRALRRVRPARPPRRQPWSAAWARPPGPRPRLGEVARGACAACSMRLMVAPQRPRAGAEEERERGPHQDEPAHRAARADRKPISALRSLRFWARRRSSDHAEHRAARILAQRRGRRGTSARPGSPRKLAANPGRQRRAGTARAAATRDSAPPACGDTRGGSINRNSAPATSSISPDMLAVSRRETRLS